MLHFCPKIVFSSRKKIQIKNVRMYQIWGLQNKDNTNRRRMVYVCALNGLWFILALH